MSGYIVAPNVAQGAGNPVIYLSDIATTGTGITLTATGGSSQTLYTTAYQLPAGKYLINVEIQVTLTGGPVWGALDWIVFNIQGAVAPASPNPQCAVTTYFGAAYTSIMNCSGLMVLSQADNIRINCSAYGAAAGKKVLISGFTYQAVS